MKGYKPFPCVSCGTPVLRRFAVRPRCPGCVRMAAIEYAQRVRAARPLQQKAGTAVWTAISRGELDHPAHHKCVDCARPAQCYDHRDYRKPLDVVPVCRSCNAKRGTAEPYRSQAAA